MNREVHVRFYERRRVKLPPPTHLRIATKTYSEAIAALEVLDDEARRLGLAINERKTYTFSQGKYVDVVNRPQVAIASAMDAVRAKLAEVDMYSFELIEPSEAIVLREASIELVTAWEESLRDDHEDFTLDDVETARGLRTSLLVLAALNDGTVLNSVPKIFQHEPQLTHVACMYLNALVEGGIDIVPAVAATVESLGLTKWQNLWLLSVMERPGIAEFIDRHVFVSELSRFSGWAKVTDSSVVPWMRAMCSDTHEIVRGQAVWALARGGNLSFDEWSRIGEARSPILVPSMEASAATLVRDGKADKGILGPGRLDSLIHDWVRGVLEDPQP